MTKKLLIALLTATMWFLTPSCKDDPPGLSHQLSIQLSVENASCTEAWLKVSLTDANEPRTIAIEQGGQRVLTARIAALDSVVMVENLLPRHSYTYTAVRLQDTTAIDRSSPVQLTTMDTTSHEFIWEADTMGIGFSNVLNDVAIINDTLAYAVGEMYLRDSTGQLDPRSYNMAKWNGTSWQLIRIQFYTICGQSSRTPYPAKSVFAFGSGDVWIAMDGSQLARWDGTTQTATICNPDPFVINKIWGETPNSIFAVGLGGRIGHYFNGTWQRIESGTTETINDVWGGSNPLLGENVVVMAVGPRATLGESKFLRIHTSTGQLDSINWPDQLFPRYSLWFDDRSRVYTAGGGVFASSNRGWFEISQLPSVVSNRIRGNGPNDIIVGGDFGMLAHCSGTSWHVYPNLGAGSYKSVAIRGNLVIAVGWIGARAFALVGRR